MPCSRPVVLAPARQPAISRRPRPTRKKTCGSGCSCGRGRRRRSAKPPHTSPWPWFRIGVLRLAAAAFSSFRLGEAVAVAQRRHASAGGHGSPQCLVTLAIVDALGTILLCRPTLYTTETRPRWDRINAERRSELSVDQGLTRVTRLPEWLGPQLNNRNIALRIATLDNPCMTDDESVSDPVRTQPLLAATSTGADRMWFAPAAAFVTPNDAADVRHSAGAA